ncbi:cellulase family glycosylhydrolase [Duganella sp. FT135W]|uniref:Cellulase family glycosylhydrolase n=1 Tax=Duganella flavida TaxID=2692175 RepID=A0A6L8K558_9BURK|nr:glycoside hydrolase family 5 protein [Duganella flavida]MYM21114.1 cellulase family glycosylhydrolase [Duganella flavida]
MTASALAMMLGACGGSGGTAAAASTSTSAPPPVVTPSSGTCSNAVTVPPYQTKTSLPFCASLSTAAAGSDGVGAENGKACQQRSGFDIVAEMGAGWNLGNTLDASGNTASSLADETFWGNPVTTKANIDALKKAGFSSLRLPVSWDDHISGEGKVIDRVWLDRVEEVANYALANDMLVIVNIHHNKGWEMPTLANEAVAKEVLTKLWTQIAARFKPYEYRLIFEVMNEPRVTVDGVDDWGGKAEYYDVLNRLNATALATIRASGGNNARRLVMLPTYAAAPGEQQLNGLLLPNDKMVALSTHAYSPYDFALNQKGSAVFTGQAELDALFQRLNTRYVQKGTPVIMGEWASTDKNNAAERVKHAQYFARGARLAGIPTLWWDNGNLNWSATSTDVMGIFDRRTNSFTHQDIVDAIMCSVK